MAVMLVGDAILLPGLVRKQNIREAEERANAPPEIVHAGRAADRHA